MQVRIFPLSTNKERTYILLTEVMDVFEPAIQGGRSKQQRAKQLAKVQHGNCPVIEDDIDFTKKIFRSRSKFVVTKFLDDFNVKNGDLLKLVKVAPYSYVITRLESEN